MKKVIMLIMPLMLTVVGVQAQNQKEMRGSNIKTQEFSLRNGTRLSHSPTK